MENLRQIVVFRIDYWLGTQVYGCGIEFRIILVSIIYVS